MTTTINTNGSVKTIKLSKDTEFTRVDDEGWSFSTTVMAGVEVEYAVEHTATETIHTATYHDADGEWTSTVRKPRVFANPASAVAPQVTAPTMSKSDVADAAARIEKAMGHTTDAAGAGAMRYASRGVTADNASEAKARRLERAAKILSGRIYQVTYGIPDELKKLFPNPCRIFKRHCLAWLDGSNFLFGEEGLNHADVQAVLKKWQSVAPIDVASVTLIGPIQRRVRHWITPLTKEQVEPMRESAMEQLAEELQFIHHSLIERIDSAAERLKEARDAVDATPKDRDAATKAHTAALRSTVREACERFETCLRSAELFDDTGKLDHLFDALRDAIDTQRIAANATLRARGVKTIASEF